MSTETVDETSEELEARLRRWIRDLERALTHAFRDRDAYRETLTVAQEAGTKLALRVQYQADSIQQAHGILAHYAHPDDVRKARDVLRGAMV